MKYIISESQVSDLVLKTVFNKDPKKKSILSKLFGGYNSDHALGMSILDKVKKGDFNYVTEIKFSNLSFLYKFSIDGFPFFVSYSWNNLNSKNNKLYRMWSPLMSGQEIDLGDDLISLITDYVFPKGYELAETLKVLDRKGEKKSKRGDWV